MARNAPPAPIHAEAPVESRPVVVRIGIARDSAFHFYYNDNLETLERLGAELVPFSPIHDRCVPDGLHGIYVGGGYPEEYAEPLSANASMIDSFRRFAGSGRPLYAECGGLMYLSQGIEIGSGRFYPMAGLLPASTKMAARRKMLGYVETLLLEDSLFGLAGTVIRGHEFHYSELIGDPASDGWKPVHRLRYIRGRSDADEGFQKGGVLAGYAHLHFASRPETAERFISLCERAHANEPY
jgi:cobyrinic acid a,c-diamide synthase